MEIQSIQHKALRRFYVDGNAKGLDGNLVSWLRKMLFFIVTTEDFESLMVPQITDCIHLRGIVPAYGP
jgi:toxin HigB-1